jgi:hypothetical protein
MYATPQGVQQADQQVAPRVNHQANPQGASAEMARPQPGPAAAAGRSAHADGRTVTATNGTAATGPQAPATAAGGSGNQGLHPAMTMSDSEVREAFKTFSKLNGLEPLPWLTQTWEERTPQAAMPMQHTAHAPTQAQAHTAKPQARRSAPPDNGNTAQPQARPAHYDDWDDDDWEWPSESPSERNDESPSDRIDYYSPSERDDVDSPSERDVDESLSEQSLSEHEYDESPSEREYDSLSERDDDDSPSERDNDDSPSEREYESLSDRDGNDSPSECGGDKSPSNREYDEPLSDRDDETHTLAAMNAQTPKRRRGKRPRGRAYL